MRYEYNGHAAEVRSMSGKKSWHGANDAPLSQAAVLAAATPLARNSKHFHRCLILLVNQISCHCG